MAAAPTFGAADNLSLGAGWEPQGSDGALAQTRASQGGSTGDIIAETVHNAIHSGSTRYIYTGAETAFAAAIEAATAWPGNVLNSLLITGLAIDYSPCAAGKRPVVTFTHRDGPSASLRQYKTVIVLPTYVAVAVSVPELLTVAGGDAEVVNAQWSIAAQFGEDFDKDGEFLAGAVYQGEETINLTFAGEPTSITSTGWQRTAGISATCPIRLNTGYGAGGGETFVRGVTLTEIE